MDTFLGASPINFFDSTTMTWTTFLAVQSRRGRKQRRLRTISNDLRFFA
jgi:hypothetical protein